MDLNQAYQILELSPGVSEEELNKQFKKLAAKHHPDRNGGSKEAEKKSKEISEAYTFLKNYKEPEVSPFDFGAGFNPFTTGINIEDFFQNQDGFTFRRKIHPPIEIPITISFAEAVLGCQKKISFERFGQCKICHGRGYSLKDDCKKCNGKGFKIHTQKYGNQDLKVKEACNACSGMKKETEKCKNCDGNASVKENANLDVKIPGGVVSGNKLKLAFQGHFEKQFVSGDTYLNIKVNPEPGLSLVGQNVLSHLDLTFLEALKGTSKKVKTVKGEYQLSIPPLSKDKDSLNIINYGVNGGGSQIVFLNVKYPNDEKVKEIISILEKE